jgi:hypothetical protein
MNSDKRMAELYAGQAEGKEYLYRRCVDREWKPRCLAGNPDKIFYNDCEYKLVPEVMTLEEFIDDMCDAVKEYSGRKRRRILMRKTAKWAWANPESNPRSKE